MERALNALSVRRPVEMSQDASAQHYDSARPRSPDWSASAKQMNSENWKEIELNYCGTKVKGIYKVSDRLVTVVYGSRTKTAKLGIFPAEMLAHMLLRELEYERRETTRNTLGERTFITCGLNYPFNQVQQSKSENTYPDRSDNGCQDEQRCYPSR
jgi:hypothetical protein